MNGEIAHQKKTGIGKGEKVTIWEKLAYGVGDAGCNFIWVVVGSFLTLYYTDSVGISAGVVGTIMLITRLLDGVSDIAMGAAIDRTNTRWGKARPWLLFSAPFMALGLVLLFNVPVGLTDNGKIIYAFLTYVFLAVIVYTIANLSYTTLLSLMTTSQEVRTSVSSIRYFVTMIAILAISYGTTPLIAKVGWGKMAVIFGFIGMVLILIAFAGTRERSLGNKVEEKDKMSVKESFQILFKNKYFVLVGLLFVINYVIGGATNGAGIYFAKDVLGNMGIFGTLIMASMVPSMIGVAFLPKLTEKLGKWKCLMIGYVLQLLSYVMIAIAPYNIPLVLTALVIKSMGMLPHMAIMFALVADVVDYGEWKTGKRIDGMTYSAVSFGMKVGTGIGTAIIGWSLQFGGYDGSLMTQGSDAITSIIALYAYIPIAFVIIGIVVLYFTNLENIFPQMHAELNERKGITQE